MGDLRVRLCEWRWIGEVVVGDTPVPIKSGVTKSGNLLLVNVCLPTCWVGGWVDGCVGGWVGLPPFK